MADEPGSIPDEEPRPSEPGQSSFARFRRGFVRGVAIAAVALFVAFALANVQPVEFSWLFGRTQIQEVGGERVGGGVPLILLLLPAFVLGAVVGWAVTTLRARARRRAARA